MQEMILEKLTVAAATVKVIASIGSYVVLLIFGTNIAPKLLLKLTDIHFICFYFSFL